MAMKVKVKNPKTKFKAMKVKGKVQHVQKAEDEAQKVAEAQQAATKKATATAKKKTKAKGNAAAATKKNALAKKAAEAKKKSAMKKPASWDAWAGQEEDDDDCEGQEEEEEEEEELDKDYNAPSKAQCKVFEDALKKAPGSRGSLPVEIHEVWNNMQRGPGSAKERHALRNAIVPRDACYGHVCTLDPNGPMMHRIKEVFEVKQKKVQMKGLTESEVLWNSFQGNEDAMQKAIQKGDLKVINGMYYWHRDIHEHITGGKDKFNFKTDPHQPTLEDKEKMMELLDYAPWAKWGTGNNNVPVAELKHVVKPNSDAMHKVQECLDASKAVCISVKNFFKQLQGEGILKSPEAGSIPSIMKIAVETANQLEKDHMQPMAALIYDTDGTNKATVKDVKEMLNAAAKALTPLQQYLVEAKALVQKFKSKDNKKSLQP